MDRKNGHCSVDDAAACMQLVKLKLMRGLLPHSLYPPSPSPSQFPSLPSLLLSSYSSPAPTPLRVVYSSSCFSCPSSRPLLPPSMSETFFQAHSLGCRETAG
eukprot:759984-Hanusia_phi.AAC.1